MKINRTVEHEGIFYFWDGKEFLVHSKNTLYAVKKDDELLPELTNKLLVQNNVTNIDELRNKINAK